MKSKLLKPKGKLATEPGPSDAQALPAELQKFAGKSSNEFLQIYFNPEQSEKMAGIMSGFISDFDLGVPIPDFAKRASKQFWKYYVGDKFSPENSLKDFGVLMKCYDLKDEAKSTTESKERTAFEEDIPKILPVLLELMEKELAALSDKEKADYYTGRTKGSAVVEKMKSPFYLKMMKRAPIYLFISALWREFERFESQAEAERWLRSAEIIDGKVSASEVRAVFRNIGLRYRGQGRPKKQKTHVGE